MYLLNYEIIKTWQFFLKNTLYYLEWIISHIDTWMDYFDGFKQIFLMAITFITWTTSMPHHNISPIYDGSVWLNG